MNNAGPQKPGPRHSLTDHAFGELAGHAHGEGEDLDHTHDDSESEFLDARAQELVGVPLLSMGVDVGSSGTQVVFSRLVMRGPGDPAALRRAPKSRETLYLSPVVMTPYKSATEIDAERVRDIVDAAFAAAGVDQARQCRSDNATSRRGMRRTRHRGGRPPHGGDARRARVGGRAPVA
jgi:ethanolamine utilization protein EutA